MRLGIKLAVLLVLPLILLTLVIGYAYQRQSSAQLREELSKEGRAISTLAQTACEDYVRDRQFKDLKHLVERMSGYERVVGFRLFSPDSRLIYQSTSLDSFPFRNYGELAKVLKDGAPREFKRMLGTESAVGFIYPMHSDNGHLIGAIQMLQLESYMQEDARRNRKFIVILTLATLIATIAVVLTVTRWSVTVPIARLVASFREVGSREHPARVTVRGDDELSWLASEFNGMCERLDHARDSLLEEQDLHRQTEAHLRMADRLAGLGRLAAGLAHEIGTPLNVISGRAEALQRELAGQDAAQRNLQIISAQIDRIARTVRDMLDFARMKPQRRAVTDLSAVVQQVLDLVEPQLRSRKITLELSVADPLPQLSADPDQMQQVFLNLCLNAMDAMSGGGVLRVRVAAESRRAPDTEGPPLRVVCVHFEDSGAGIASEHKERIFDPFFTTKQVGRGTGLGLSVSYGIVREHGGWFAVDSEPGQGTRVVVILPIDERPGLTAQSGTRSDA